MSTSSSSQTIPSVRTYAGDLDLARAQRNNSPTAVAPTKTPTIVATTAVTESPTVSLKTDNDSIIPPFHTFSQPEKTADQIETQKILTNSSTLSQNGTIKEALPAVIITDTKRKRFNFSAAVTSSIQDWWTAKKEDAQKKKIPRYTVPEAERRKGVIQKATVKTGRTSSDDHESVVSRIKASKQAAPIPRIATVIAPEETPSEPAWESTTPVLAVPKKVAVDAPEITYVTNKQAPAAKELASTEPEKGWESDIQAQVNALGNAQPISNIILTGKEFSKIKQQRLVRNNEIPALDVLAVKSAPTATRQIKPIIPNIQSKPITPIEPLPFKEMAPRIVRPVTPIQPEVVIKNPILPTPINRPKIVPILPEKPVPSTAVETVVYLPTEGLNTITPLPVEPESIQAAEPRKEERRFAPPRKNRRTFLTILTQTNPIVFTVFGVLIFVVTSGLIIRSFVNGPSSEVAAIDTQHSSSVFIDTVPNEAIIITTKADIASALQAQTSGTDSLTEITMVGQSGNTLTAAELFTILNASVIFDFKSTITNVSLGTYRDAPWIVFTVADKNTALGGMLNWEKAMVTDLSFIYEPASTNALPNNQFIDSIIGTTDVRVLKNMSGEDEMTYGFVNANTILITTDETAFLNLAGKI